jgi:hypothetical protein
MENEIDTPRYQLAIAAFASGVENPEILRQWIARAAKDKSIPVDLGEGKISGGRPGRVNLYSLRSIYRFAIVARLTNLGMSVSVATAAALKFTDLGSPAPLVTPMYEKGEDISDVMACRPPGELYNTKECYTYLRMTDKSVAEVIPVPKDGAMQGLFFGVWSHVASVSDTVVLIDLNMLVKEVDNRLSEAISGAGE